MKNYKYYISIFSIILFSFAFVSCDEDGKVDGEDIRTTVGKPVIDTFSPTTGAPGTQIMIEGNNLSSVDTIRIGNALVNVKNKISNTKILAEVTANAQSGKISVRNPKGTVESADDFTVLVVLPTLESVETNVPGELTSGETNLIKGTNLKSVTTVLVADVDAKIIFTSDTEIRFIVPILKGVSSGKITMQYLDNTATTQSIESNETFNIAGSTVTPIVTEIPTSASIWTEITVKGTNLDVVDYALLGDMKIDLSSKTPTEIKLTIPTNFSAEAIADLIFVYNAGNEVVACKNFKVTIPAISTDVKFFGGLSIEAQDPEMSNQFFHAPTGTFYSACTNFETIKAQTYFFITWSDSNQTFQINNPANSASQTSMFMCSGVNLPGEKLPNVVKFKILKASISKENDLINKVKSRTLGAISPAIISELSITNASTSAPRYNIEGANATNPFEVGTVLMFQKFNSAATVVEEVGFIEILGVDIPDDVKKKSTMKFNCFFQK